MLIQTALHKINENNFHLQYLYAVAGEKDLLKGSKLIVDKDILIILSVISIHLIVVVAGLYQSDPPILLSRDIVTLSLLVDSSDRPTSPIPKQALGLSLGLKDTKDSEVQVSSISIAGDSKTKVLSPALMSKGIQARDKFVNPRPPYPLVSRRMGEQGAVDLQLCVTHQGHVESVVVMKSSGYQRLDRSALETVKAWKFSALDIVETSSSECYRLPIHFKLEA